MKFNNSDIVKCKFNGKYTYGIVICWVREYIRHDLKSKKLEFKYKIKLNETEKSQLKWEHELKLVKSFNYWIDAMNFLRKQLPNF